MRMVASLGECNQEQKFKKVNESVTRLELCNIIHSIGSPRRREVLVKITNASHKTEVCTREEIVDTEEYSTQHI